MNHQFDVLVIGGGIVGLTAALAMAQRNYSVAVIDAGALSADITIRDMRVYAINRASQALFNELEVWRHMDSSRLAPYSQMHVWDALSGAYIDFDARIIAEQNLGTIIEESILKMALLDQVSIVSNISLFPHNAVNEVVPSEQNVRIFSQEHSWDGQLLMIADGAHSPARQKLNVELTSWPYNQNALITTVTTEKSHQNTAWQIFNPDGPLAFLPLANPFQSSIVWSTHPQRVEHLLALDEEEFNTELSKAFAQHLGRVCISGTRHQFPLLMRHVKQYTGLRWLLLGDAAHTIHPLAGLGLNVGLADIKSWLKYLDMGNGCLVSNRMLGSYQRERKHAVWQIIMLMEGFKRLFGNSASSLTALRGLGLRACNDFTPIKRLFINHAAG